MKPWVLMWLLAFALFGLAKWGAWRPLQPRPVTGRAAAFFFLWPGMDARAFLDESRRPARPAAREFAGPLFRLGLGVALIWFGVRWTHPHGALLGGWVGMFGLILLLHFGSFDLLSLLWRRAGVNADPIMRRP